MTIAMNNQDTDQVTESAAEIYDRFFVPALFADWPARVLDAVGVREGERVLDVACGTGVLAAEAAVRVGATGSVTGLDINQNMLDVARDKRPAIDWRPGTAESLPFEAGTFDRVVSQFGLMFFQDPVKAIQEMHRVARPGGGISIAVWAPLDKTPGYKAMADLLTRLFGVEIAKSIESPYVLGDPEALKNLFGRAGTPGIRIQTHSGKARFSSVEAWVYTDIKGWTLADVLDEDDYQTLLQQAPEALARFLQPDGTVEFSAPAHIVTWRR